MQFKPLWDRANQSAQEHLKEVVSEAFSQFNREGTDAMHSIQTDADGICWMVGKDARTCIGGMVMYHLAHGVTLCIDTVRGGISASTDSEKFSREFHEDPAGFQIAVSDLYWARRS